MTKDISQPKLLTHGGKLIETAQHYGIPLDHWLDLSTGVNPRCYPVKAIPERIWNRLPEDDDELVEVAEKYYQSTSLLPVAGTQAAIQTLPVLLQSEDKVLQRVALPEVGYKEHAHAWHRSSYELVTYQNEPTEALVESVDILVVINPNNPTAHRVNANSLLQWHQSLQLRGGYLIVDEAFMDANASQSISHLPSKSGLIILRSVGKFFGLAGIRAGFVLAEALLLHRLQFIIGPWSLSGPAREVCKQALSDSEWQRSNRAFLQYASQRLESLLTRYFDKTFRTDLFVTVRADNAESLHMHLCRKAVFTRLLDEKNGLRFGLPDHEQDWHQLSKALYEIRREEAL